MRTPVGIIRKAALCDLCRARHNFHSGALSAPAETFGRAEGRGRRHAPSIRAKFGEGLRPRRYARPEVYAPPVQAVPFPTLPISATTFRQVENVSQQLRLADSRKP
jgi:hypothetical protein